MYNDDSVKLTLPSNIIPNKCQAWTNNNNDTELAKGLRVTLKVDVPLKLPQVLYPLPDISPLPSEPGLLYVARVSLDAESVESGSKRTQCATVDIIYVLTMCWHDKLNKK